jgi:hypothetical protein
MWIAVLIGVIPGFFGSKEFTHELKTRHPSYDACETSAHEVARFSGFADIDPNYKVACRKVSS